MLTDAELVDGVVAGYDDAFAELYERHSLAAWRLGQTVTGNADDAADAVAEAFARVLVAVRAGHLDNGSSFRSYLLTATRNAALDNIRKTGRSRPTEGDILAELESASPTPPERLSGDEEAALIAEAFRNLPERWRSVLWLTEVEDVATKEAARRLGLTPNGAAQLAVRARAGLRERFLQAHLRKTSEPECQATVQRLGAYVGGGLAPRDLAKVDQHLAGCSSCQTRKEELEDVRTSLRRAALPVPLAVAGAAGAASGPAAVATGGTVAKVLLWAQQAWAQKAVAAAAAGALTLGTGGAYLAGTADERPSEANPATVTAVEEVAAPQLAAPLSSPEAAPVDLAPGQADAAPPAPAPAAAAPAPVAPQPECAPPAVDGAAVGGGDGAAPARGEEQPPFAPSDAGGAAGVAGEGGKPALSFGGVLEEGASEGRAREIDIAAAVAELKAQVALSSGGVDVGVDVPTAVPADPGCSGAPATDASAGVGDSGTSKVAVHSR